MSNKIEMNCACSNEYCFDKVPAEALIPIIDKPGEFRVRIVKVSPCIVNPVKIISWEEWEILCENCRCDDEGRIWKPYVPARK